MFNIIIHFLQQNKLWLIWSTSLSFVGLLTIGIPGAAIMTLIDYTATPIITGVAFDDIHRGDNTWPIAVGYSVLLPWVAFGLFLLLKAVKTDISKRNVCLLIFLIMTVMLVVFQSCPISD
jgi:hypothetical protein